MKLILPKIGRNLVSDLGHKYTIVNENKFSYWLDPYTAAYRYKAKNWFYYDCFIKGYYILKEKL